MMLVWPLCGPISGLSLFFQQSGRFILLQIALFSVANNTTRARFAHFDCFTFGWGPCSRNLWLLNTGVGVSSITYLHPLTYSPPPPCHPPWTFRSLEYIVGADIKCSRLVWGIDVFLSPAKDLCPAIKATFQSQYDLTRWNSELCW